MGTSEMEFVQDEEFEALLPELTDEEHHLLKQSLLAEGCHDPIVLWQGKDILLDGHNRVEICDEADPPIAYSYVEVDLPDRDAAKVWIVKNARARRNLTPDKISYLRGLQYTLEKKPHGGDRKSSPHNEDLKTTERLAEEHGVGHATVERDAEYATAVDTLAENVAPAIKQQILSGEAKLSKKDVVAIAELPKAQQKKVVKEHLGGDKKAVREAVKKADAKRATAGLPEGKTPHQEADEDPERRWHASLHKIYVFMNSTRDLGGILVLTEKWTRKGMDEWLAELKRIVGELNEWIRILEKKK